MWPLPIHPNHYIKKAYQQNKAKLRVAIKEFRFLNLVTIYDKMEKNYSINEQQMAEIDELYDEIREIVEPIKNLEILFAKK